MTLRKRTLQPKEEMKRRADSRVRFEKVIGGVAQSGPTERLAPQRKERPMSKGRVRKGKSRS